MPRAKSNDKLRRDKRAGRHWSCKKKSIVKSRDIDEIIEKGFTKIRINGKLESVPFTKCKIKKGMENEKQ